MGSSRQRVLVTGAAGFIGANLVANLAREGHEVTAIDVKAPPHQREGLLTGAARVDLEVDLREPYAADAAVAIAEPDVVYHLAADHGGAGYFYGPADYKAAMNNLTIDNNVREAVLEGARRGLEQRVFFASSACTYPTTIQGAGAAALREGDWGGGPAEALYGEAKRMSTLLFEGAREHGLDARCGLFHTIYGPGQDYLEPRAKFPTAICRKVLEAVEETGVYTPPDVEVEVWGDGTQRRTFLYIDDALTRIRAVAEADEYEGPVNIGSDESVSVAECVDYVGAAAGVKVIPRYDTTKPTGVDDRAADCSEFNRRYGVRSQRTAQWGFGRLYASLADTLRQ